MPTSPGGRIAAFASFSLLLAVCLAVNGYLAYCVTYPARTLRVRIVVDPLLPAAHAVSPDELKARVESISPYFERAARMRIAVAGFAKLQVESNTVDPDALRTFIDFHTPRDGADVLVTFWSAPAGNKRPGSTVPFSGAAVVRLDSGSAERDRAVLVRELASVLGVPGSADPQSTMSASPASPEFDPASRALLNETRLFDFEKGLAGMSQSMQRQVLDLLGRHASSEFEVKSKDPRLRLAELLVRQGELAAAIAQYRLAAKSDEKNIEARLGLAHTLAFSGDAAAAEAEARAALRMAPGNDAAHYELGYVFARAGKPESAIPELQKAISIAPNSARNHAGLAVAYAASFGQFEAAAREFDEARKIDPKDSRVLADEAYVKKLQGRIDNEAAQAESKVREHPDSGPAHNRLALLLVRQNKTDEALNEAREALKLSPEMWQTHYTVAVALYAKHDLANAEQELEQAEKLGSGRRPELEEALRLARAAVK